MKNLYLIPTSISENTSCIPIQSIEVIRQSTHFICERIRTTRRFIKLIIPDFDIDQSIFIELDKRNDLLDNNEIMDLLKKGQDLAFMSEAGSPCIADPGSSLVNVARDYKYIVHPLTGPSSIILALMASGMNGQNFTFRGYLPVKKDKLIKELKKIGETILQTGYTQIFIETPYRNISMYNAIIEKVNINLRLNISLGIYSLNEYIETKKISDWKKDQEIIKKLEMKVPCIFLLGK